MIYNHVKGIFAFESLDPEKITSARQGNPDHFVDLCWEYGVEDLQFYIPSSKVVDLDLWNLYRGTEYSAKLVVSWFMGREDTVDYVVNGENITFITSIELTEVSKKGINYMMKKTLPVRELGKEIIFRGPNE